MKSKSVIENSQTLGFSNIRLLFQLDNHHKDLSLPDFNLLWAWRSECRDPSLWIWFLMRSLLMRCFQESLKCLNIETIIQWRWGQWKIMMLKEKFEKLLIFILKCRVSWSQKEHEVFIATFRQLNLNFITVIHLLSNLKMGSPGSCCLEPKN